MSSVLIRFGSRPASGRTAYISSVLIGLKVHGGMNADGAAAVADCFEYVMIE